MNINNSCSCQLGEAGERNRGEEVTATDRLSHLPDFIIHHILSFLDTKAAVQTCVLSRGWRCAWKHVPVLHLHSNSFEQYSSFQRYVDCVLSLRGPFHVETMIYIDNEYSDWEGRDVSFFVKVINYALSFDTQHLEISLAGPTEVESRFSDLFGTISNCDLKTLLLSYVEIDDGFGSSDFRMLTSLRLSSCFLVSDLDEDFDPFSGFPCLKNLDMNNCLHMDFMGEKSLLISGAQLVNLELDNLICSKIEIFAPRLQVFNLRQDLQYLNFSKLCIPSLLQVNIDISDCERLLVNDTESASKSLICLLRGLGNARSLLLTSSTIQVLSNINSEFLERQPSPFSGVKFLIVNAESPETLSHALLNYFLKGSSSMNVVFAKHINSRLTILP